MSRVLVWAIASLTLFFGLDAATPMLSGAAPSATSAGRPAPELLPAIPAQTKIEDVKRSVEGLSQVGKAEEAFYMCASAVKGDLKKAGALQAQAMSSLQKNIGFIRQGMADKQVEQTWEYVRKLWPALVEPSTASLFPTLKDYQRALQEVYPLAFDCTYALANSYKNKGNYARALVLAEYCVGYKPGEPDPRAVKLRDELQALAGVSKTPNATAGVTPTVAAGNPSAATVELRMNSPANNGYSMAGTQALAGVRLGGMNCHSLLVFPNCSIPKGATIKKASLHGYFEQYAPWGKPPMNTFIYGEDADKPQPVLPDTNLPKERVLTSQKVEWIIQNPAPGPYESPDISAIVQTIVNRPGYQPGDNLNLIIYGGKGTCDWISYEKDPERAFRLSVSY